MRLDFVKAIKDVVAGTRISKEQSYVNTVAKQIVATSQTEPEKVAAMLHTALAELDKQTDHVAIAVTGLGWLGSGVQSVEQHMTSLVRGSEREILLCCYSVTSGAKEFLSDIAEAVSQGKSATLILNSFSKQPTDIQTLLRNCSQKYGKRFQVFNFEGATNSELHAKVLVIDRSTVLIGSANLSFHGMVSNHEMAVIVRGPTAERIAARIDLLRQFSSVKSIT